MNDLGRLFGDLRRVAVPEVRGVVTAAKRGITAALVEEAQEASPSSTGRYRASHRASIGFPSTAKLSGPGPFSAPTPAEISASLARLRSPGPITYVANDTPYAAEVEERHQVYARAIAAVEGRGDEIIDRAVTGGGQ